MKSYDTTLEYVQGWLLLVLFSLFSSIYFFFFVKESFGSEVLRRWIVFLKQMQKKTSQTPSTLKI